MQQFPSAQLKPPKLSALRQTPAKLEHQSFAYANGPTKCPAESAKQEGATQADQKIYSQAGRKIRERCRTLQKSL